MLLQLHISERTGRGVPKITEVYGKGTYEFRENSIVVSIPFTRVSTEDEDPRWTEIGSRDRTQDGTQEDSKGSSEDEKIKRILEFCQTPKRYIRNHRNVRIFRKKANEEICQTIG